MLALTKSPHFTELDEFRKWAEARLRWLALDELRAQRRFVNFESESTLSDLRESDPDDMLATSLERTQALEHVLSHMPERPKAIVLGVLEGRSNKELADALGITESSVRSLLRFARVRIAEATTKPDSK